MKIGLIARQDNGGLAAQSQEFAAHLPIESTLVVDMGNASRGINHDFPWVNPIYVTGPRIENAERVKAFVKSVDVILSIETFYGAGVIAEAQKQSVPTVRYANPELYKFEGEDFVVAPTDWELGRFKGRATVIRQGIDIPERVLVRDRPAHELMHFRVPAMLDRHGSIGFQTALQRTATPFRVHLIGPRTTEMERRSIHTYIDHNEYRPNRFDLFTDEMDLLVLPRKYAGLSLVMLEAASRGIPTLATDIPPQNGWFTRDALVPVIRPEVVEMVGGSFNVYSVNPDVLARRLDELANMSLAPLSRHAIEWAKLHDWEVIRPIWIDYLARVTA